MKLALFLLLATGLSRGAIGPEMAPDSALASDAERARLQFFESEIRPLLAKRCYECHGDKKQKSGLRLDNIAHILAGGIHEP